jgi:hydrogenase nickel incorporation protein HypB
MCDTCGCNVTATNNNPTAVKVLQNLLTENDHQARHNREHFIKHGVFAINLMSAPGSGKTSLLEATIKALQDEFKIAVIEGDLETENDAQRIRQTGVPAVQIVTGTACHLDANLVHLALHDLDLANIELLFIENVGNLVCPASFDLGHHRNVVLLSLPEGDDKPAKYPVMFKNADLILITKMDLLPLLDDFSPQRAIGHVQNLANPAPVLQLSAKNPASLNLWLDWIRKEIYWQRQVYQNNAA